MASRGRIVTALITLVLFAAPAAAADAERASATAQIAEVTDKLISADVDIEKFCLKYRYFGTQDPKLRNDRYTMLQEASVAEILAQSVISTGEVASHMKKPGRTKNHVLHRALVNGIVGSAIGAGSSAFELACNSNTWLRNKEHGDDPATALRMFRVKLAEVDRLLTEQKRLQQEITDPAVVEVFASEGRLLRLYRDLQVYEMADFYADVRSYQPGNNVFYSLNTASNGMGIGVYSLGIRGLKRNSVNGPENILSLVSDSVTAITAPTSTIAQALLYKHWRKQFMRQLGERAYDAEDQAKKEMAVLQALCTKYGAEPSAVAHLDRRMRAYTYWTSKFDTYLDRKKKNLRETIRLAIRANIAGPLIATTAIAQDILGLASFYTPAKPHTAQSMALAGDISLAAGAGISTSLTALWYVQGKLHDRELAKQRRQPDQVLADRLQTLDGVDRIMKGQLPQ